MSSRCVLVLSDTIRGERAQYYRHCDGTPRFTGKELVGLLDDLDKSSQYTFQSVKERVDTISSYESEDVGRGHGDIEYLYTIDIEDNNEIIYNCQEVYKVNGTELKRDVETKHYYTKSLYQIQKGL